MNSPEIWQELIEKHGYKVHGRLPSGFIFRAPDGRLLREHEIEGEMERLTKPDTEKV